MLKTHYCVKTLLTFRLCLWNRDQHQWATYRQRCCSWAPPDDGSVGFWRCPASGLCLRDTGICSGQRKHLRLGSLWENIVKKQITHWIGYTHCGPTSASNKQLLPLKRIFIFMKLHKVITLLHFPLLSHKDIIYDAPWWFYLKGPNHNQSICFLFVSMWGGSEGEKWIQSVTTGGTTHGLKHAVPPMQIV